MEIKTYAKLNISVKDILRYASCPVPSDETLDLLSVCLNKTEGEIVPKLISTELERDAMDKFCENSKLLTEYFSGCEKAVLFVATIGNGIDRLTASASVTSVAEAQMYQAIGTQQVEELCDTFCKELKEKYKKSACILRPRVSPGYGDLKLEVQKDVFRILDCSRIGISLTDSLLMRPSKSVTAFIAVEKEE